MGQAFRKLFDAFFGNKEMRVRCLRALYPFDSGFSAALTNRSVPFTGMETDLVLVLN